MVWLRLCRESSIGLPAIDACNHGIVAQCNATDSCVGVLAKPQPERLVPPDPGDTEQGCGQGLDAGPGIGQVMQLLPNATGPPVIAPGVYTKHFAWRNGSGGLHEVVSRQRICLLSTLSDAAVIIAVV